MYKNFLENIHNQNYDYVDQYNQYDLEIAYNSLYKLFKKEIIKRKILLDYESLAFLYENATVEDVYYDLFINYDFNEYLHDEKYYIKREIATKLKELCKIVEKYKKYI